MKDLVLMKITASHKQCIQDGELTAALHETVHLTDFEMEILNRNLKTIHLLIIRGLKTGMKAE